MFWSFVEGVSSMFISNLCCSVDQEPPAAFSALVLPTQNTKSVKGSAQISHLLLAHHWTVHLIVVGVKNSDFSKFGLVAGIAEIAAPETYGEHLQIPAPLSLTREVKTGTVPHHALQSAVSTGRCGLHR